MNASRRTILIRVGLWTAGGVLALMLYLAGAPIVVCTVLPRFPSAIPVLVVVYSPIDYWLQQGWPGSGPYRAYGEWCRNELDPEHAILAPVPQIAQPVEVVPAP